MRLFRLAFVALLLARTAAGTCIPATIAYADWTSSGGLAPSVTDFALVDETIFIARSNGALSRLDAGDSHPRLQIQLDDRIDAVAADGHGAVIVRTVLEPYRSELWTMNFDGSGLRLLASSVSSPRSLSLNADFVYWVDTVDTVKRIRRTANGSVEPDTLLTGFTQVEASRDSIFLTSINGLYRWDESIGLTQLDNRRSRITSVSAEGIVEYLVIWIPGDLREQPLSDLYRRDVLKPAPELIAANLHANIDAERTAEGTYAASSYYLGLTHWAGHLRLYPSSFFAEAEDLFRGPVAKMAVTSDAIFALEQQQGWSPQSFRRFCRDFASAPNVESITPQFGSPAGGTRVTIRGVRFGTGAEVRFDGVLASVESVSANEIVVLTPAARSPSPVDVHVINPDGRAGLGFYRYGATGGARAHAARRP